MKLTRFTDLGLRVLMYLAGAADESAVTASELATMFEVPRNHLLKVVHRLGILGWIETQRGRGGGVRLAAPARRLRLGHVVRTLEEAGALVDCDRPPCPLRRACLLQGALDDAQAAFYASLDRHTLLEVRGTPTAATLIRLGRSRRAA